MLALSVENGVFGILALLVVGSLILLHYLLFREYARQEKLQVQRLKDFENLVNLEIHRSQLLSNSVGQLQVVKEKTDEQLKVINLQIEAIDLLAPKSPPSRLGDK